jgi:hypothetical protein
MAVSNKGLLALMRRMSGQQSTSCAVDATARAINEMLDAAGENQSSVNVRQINGWLYGVTPPLAKIHLLLAAAHRGVAPAEAVELYPDLAAVEAMFTSAAKAMRLGV